MNDSSCAKIVFPYFCSSLIHKVSYVVTVFPFVKHLTEYTLNSGFKPTTATFRWLRATSSVLELTDTASELYIAWILFV